VVRLAPDRFDARPAAAEEAERTDVDDVLAGAAPQTPPANLD
jgi:hypothetical protein